MAEIVIVRRDVDLRSRCYLTASAPSGSTAAHLFLRAPLLMLFGADLLEPTTCLLQSLSMKDRLLNTGRLTPSLMDHPHLADILLAEQCRIISSSAEQIEKPCSCAQA